MPERIVVGLGERSYPIWIGLGILDQLGVALAAASFPRKVAVVSNPTVYALYGQRIEEILTAHKFSSTAILIGDGEEFKNFSSLQQIYDALIEKGFDRSSGLLALGGGVIGDITGFAAATYLRGIPFVQVPTTLLSQVDSSVGGKTAINHPLGKNLIGAFYQPVHVHIDVETLGSLPEREFSAGLAEVVKYGVIRDDTFFEWLCSHGDRLLNQDPSALIHAVKRSCQIKADVVEVDEKESTLRAILNFGHTFGHAVETLTGYGTYRHGEAVSIGMVFASEVAMSLGLCTRQDVQAIKNLLVGFRLPVSFPAFSIEQYLQAMGRDKKVKQGVLRMVLNKGIGDCLVRDVPDPEALFAPLLNNLSEG
ncbi:MAG: 3-dehydroquinate synthase [Desulfuromonadales bacterium]